MTEITAATIFASVTGFVAHIIFYPIIEAWHSRRMRRLARPMIGVLANAPVFLVWLWVFHRHSKDEERRNVYLLCGFAAYCVSFLWNGAGVVLGYLFGDWKEQA